MAVSLPWQENVQAKAYNFRRTQKRRYRGALDALRLAVEEGLGIRAWKDWEGPKLRSHTRGLCH